MFLYSVNGRCCWCCCNVSEENQQDKRISLDNSEIQSTAAGPKPSKVSRQSAPLPASPKTPMISGKASVKKVTGQSKTPSSVAEGDEGSGKRVIGGRACDKASCVRTGLKPRCFVGATQR